MATPWSKRSVMPVTRTEWGEEVDGNPASFNRRLNIRHHVQGVVGEPDSLLVGGPEQRSVLVGGAQASHIEVLKEHLLQPPDCAAPDLARLAVIPPGALNHGPRDADV